MDKIQEIIERLDNQLGVVDDVFGCKTNTCWEDLCETVGDLKEQIQKNKDTEILDWIELQMKEQDVKFNNYHDRYETLLIINDKFKLITADNIRDLINKAREEKNDIK